MIRDLSSVTNTIPSPPLNDGVSGRSQIQLPLELNSCPVLKQLAMCAPSAHQFHALCLSLARGIDHGLAQNVVPAQASKLPPVLKMVCRRKNEFYLQPVIMVLMISVKNACKLNWFPAQDTEELLTLADEVASNFVTKKDFTSDVCNLLPTVSTIIFRYYPHFKIGNVLASLEVKPGYATHLVDFQITKDIVVSKEEKIYLFVAMRDNIDTSSCVITPQEVNILLNGSSVERRNRASMDSGPQLPTSVNRYLKYGTNLLQVVGQFNGHYIFVIALMSYNPSSSALPIPRDYEQPISTAISSDSELIKGPSLVSLNCPISKIRIRIPVKGQLCKHYQSFDFTTFVEMNFKRPSWQCPICNRSVSFADLRVDQKMVKALQEVGEKESEVVFSIDGSFKPASSNKHGDESHDKALANQLGGHKLESSIMFDGPGNMFDHTGEDDEMDTTDRDTMPVDPNVQSQYLSSAVTLPPLPRSTTERTQCTSAQVSNSQSSGPRIHNSLPTGFNTRPQAQIGGMSGPITGSSGMVPVLTDAVSPALSRQPDSLGANVPISTFSSNSTPTSLQMVQEAINSQAMMNSTEFTRNLSKVSSAIQALPFQASNTSPHLPNISQQYSRPTVSLPTASVPSAPFQVPIGFNSQLSSPYGTKSTNVERQHHLFQSNACPQIPNMAPVSLQNRSLSPPVQQGVGHSTPIHNSYLSPTLSQPPHLRSSQLPRNHNQHGVIPRAGVSNSPTSNHPAFQPVQLMSSQASQMRPPHTTPLQTQPAVRMPSSSLPSSSGGSLAPQAVSRTENLINLQSEQNWRPMARMRGALAGPEYEKALKSQLGPAAPPIQTPSPKPSVPLSGVSTRPNIDIFLANRRIASELQDQSANGTQVETSHMVN